MSLPLILFGLVCATFATVGFYDKARHQKKLAEQAVPETKPSN